MARSEVQSDDFERGSLGANWTQLNSGWGSVTITGTSDIIGSSANAVGNSQAAEWAGSGTFDADQYSEVEIASLAFLSTSYRIGVLVRSSGDTGSGRDFYEACIAGNGSSTYTTYLGKVVNGTWTELHSAAVAWSATDLIGLEAEGTEIRVTKNGTPLGGSFTQTDSDLSTGTPGVVTSGDSASVAGEAWSGGDITGGAGPTAAHLLTLLGAG